MSNPTTIAGYPVIGSGAGHPIIRAGDGSLWYYAWTKEGTAYGWKVSTADHLRHHHAHHLQARAGSGRGGSIHHAAHGNTHPGAPGLNHRRVMAPAPDHAIAALHSGVQAGAGIPAGGGIATLVVTATVDREEQTGWAEKLEKFEDRHLRLLLGIQGGLDLAAGPATIATSVVIAMALAPETGGLSLMLGIGVLLYGVTRGTMQTAAGLTETVATIRGDEKQEKSVKEGMDQVKTLSSISGFLMLGTQRFRRGKLTKQDWTHAGYASDAETLLTGRGIDRAFEEASETVRITSRIATAMKWGGYADKTDQAHVQGKDALTTLDAVQKLLEQQKRNREKKSQPTSGPASIPKQGAH